MFLAAVFLWIRYQRKIIREELADEVDEELLQPSWHLLREGQWERWRHHRRLRGELATLGLLKWRTKRFGGDWERVQRLRREIATLAVYDVGAGNLPQPATPLVGREEELAKLVELDARVITLTGPGGTGKTRLALEAARSLRQHFGSGAYFVPLAPVREPGLVPAAIAETLGVAQRESESPLEPLKDYLRDKQLLLFLDNFEQVAAAAPAVAELLEAAPRVRVLATSREALRIPGEHEFPVPPLPELGAVELFEQRAQAVDPDFRVSDANRETIAEIARRLDGLPLAIELTAARVRLQSPAEILTRLETPTEASPLRETISWSYELLDGDERALLARLSVFAGGSQLRAAEFVCGDGVLDVVAGATSLAEKSLVRRHSGVGGASRIEMLETIREFAGERLEERGESSSVRRRHADHMVALAERAEPALTSPEQAFWLARLSEENANIRAALEWTDETGELELGLRLAGALVRFWSARGLMAEGRQWLERALDRAAEVSPYVATKAEFAAGYAALGLGDFADAETHFERSLALARDLDDEQQEGAALAQLGWLAMTGGRAAEAQTNAERALALARSTDDKISASGALNVLAEVAASDGDGEARRLFEEGLALRRELGDDRLIANSLLLLGRVDGSEARFQEALDLGRSLEDSWTTSVALLRLGEARGDKALVEEALVIARERGDAALVAQCESALA
jgi:predicted ATPase